MFKSYKIFFLLYLLLFLILSIPFLQTNIRAAGQGEGCTQSSQCSSSGLTCFCVSNGSCSGGYCIGGDGFCSCSNGGSCTPTAWSACVDCYRWRVCTNTGQLQVGSCDSGGCGSGNPPPSGTPACNVTLSPTSTSITALSDTTFAASVNISGAVVTRVDFSSSNTGVATVSPASDTTATYQTTATGVAGGTSTITANVIANGATLCTTTANLTVLPLGAWWQVKDGDITATGDISSTIPVASYVLDDIGSGGFPGVPVYSSAISTGVGIVSTEGWNANTATTTDRRFDYSYFDNLIPEDVVFTDASVLSTPTASQHGYEWYRATGDFTISSNIDFGTRKVILFVDSGDLNLNARVNLTDNSGFFGTFVDGDINVLSTVTGAPTLEGVYLADQSFNTGLGTSQLHMRGSVVAYGGISLSRDLTNNVSPAELFEFAPDQVLLFPEKLSYRGQKWLEVAP